MSLEPLLSASPIIQIHAFAAMAALMIGAVVLFRKKGTVPHKRLGKVWVGLMALVALSSFFIWTIRLVGPFSPIHLLSILTLVMLWRGVGFARRHKITLHRAVMKYTYFLALVITGLFTFLPGRIMNRVVFGDAGAGPLQWAIFAGAVALIALMVISLVRWRPTRLYPVLTPR